jgi:YidC/Oxa1 family membrane protein insertase
VIIYPLIQIFELTFSFSQKVFQTTWVSICCISVVINILCLPLYNVAEQWQKLERDAQKKLKLKGDKIKAVFSGDEGYMILSTYYRQNHYHPVYAMRSAFGLLIQIPFFIAAYSYLSRMEELQGASFLMIRDLGKPDALLPFTAMGINLLPILMTVINGVSGAVYTKGFPLKDKIQLYGMALLFLVLLYNSPAGLVLYWMLNNVFSLLRNCYYKLNFKHKRYALYCVLSGLCLFVSAYIGITQKRQSIIKYIVIYLFAIIAAFPWIVIAVKKLLSNKKNIAFTVLNKTPVFIFSALLLWALAGLYLPSLLVAASPQEFSFIDNYTNPLYFIYNTALQTFGLFIFLPVCLYFLFSDKTKTAFSIFFLFCAVGALLNIFLFPGDYGRISVNMQFDHSVNPKLNEIAANGMALFASIAVIVFVLRIKVGRFLAPLLLLCLISVSGVSVYNMIVINSGYQEFSGYYKAPEKVEKIEPIFNMTRNGKNVVVIMLDRAISGFIPYILEESPDLKQIYSGFTYYPNTISFNGYTAIGSPPIFGGYEYTPLEINKRNTEELMAKHNEALIMLPRLFSEAGYSVTVTDPPYANYNVRSDMTIFDDYPAINAYITDSAYTNFWLAEHQFPLPTTGDILKRNIFWYSILKIVPLLLRETLYMEGNWCAPVMHNGIIASLNGYAILDYLPRLTSLDTDDKNTCNIIVNNTTHENSFYQAPDYVPSISVTNYGTSPYRHDWSYPTNMAALKRLGDWIQFLKKEGIYDNTRIIIVSDHGPETNFVIKSKLPFNVDQFNPLLLIKDFGAFGELKTDMSFMSNADVPYSAVKDIIAVPVNPFTGKPVTPGSAAEYKETPLYVAISGSIHLGGAQSTQFILDPKQDYYIHDSIFNDTNWIPAIDFDADKWRKEK